jgi:hypothetical protein
MNLRGTNSWLINLGEDEQVVIQPTEYFTEDRYKLRICKQNGHGAKTASPSDLTNYDSLESYYLMQSVSFPFILDSILREQANNLKKLKRRVYDYIHSSAAHKFFRKILFLKFNREYSSLKFDLARSIGLFKRFEEEFSGRHWRSFTRDVSLELFKRMNISGNDRDNETSDLESHYTTSLKWRIEELNRRIQILQEIFRPIEDLNIYRSNMWLQSISIFLAIIAIILTFDKVVRVITEMLSKVME